MSDKLIKCHKCSERIWESESFESFDSNKLICKTCNDKEADGLVRELEIKELKQVIEKSKARLAELGETV